MNDSLSRLGFSRIVHGHMHLASWNLSPQQTLSIAKEAAELGITTMDHADIYGNYSCEELFGRALELDPGFRQQIQLVSKCGIKLRSDKYPERQLKTYDYSPEHIEGSVENSLRNLRTNYLDLLLLHRPAPFFDAASVAQTLTYLVQQGKVKHVGVSNFTPLQTDMLQAHLNLPLVTNQVEISPYCLEHFDNGNFDYFMKTGLQPMAWSPLAGGRLFQPKDERSARVAEALGEIAKQLGLDPESEKDKVAYAWLLAHPAGVVPVLGTGKINRLSAAVEAQQLSLSNEQWYRIYTASTGNDVP